jgi:hypothetical protein
MQALLLMMDRCYQLQISFNLKKCIFCTPFFILLGHVVCMYGFLVDPTKIVVILEMVASTLVHENAHHLGSYMILPMVHPELCPDCSFIDAGAAKMKTLQ